MRRGYHDTPARPAHVKSKGNAQGNARILGKRTRSRRPDAKKAPRQRGARIAGREVNLKARAKDHKKGNLGKRIAKAPLQ